MRPVEIKRLRLDLGMTQEDLAEVCDVLPGAIWRWEAGQAEPRPLHKGILEQLRRRTPAQEEPDK